MLHGNLALEAPCKIAQALYLHRRTVGSCNTPSPNCSMLKLVDTGRVRGDGKLSQLHAAAAVAHQSL
jgi:hypothetical protein